MFLYVAAQLDTKEIHLVIVLELIQVSEFRLTNVYIPKYKSNAYIVDLRTHIKNRK